MPNFLIVDQIGLRVVLIYHNSNYNHCVQYQLMHENDWALQYIPPFPNSYLVVIQRFSAIRCPQFDQFRIIAFLWTRDASRLYNEYPRKNKFYFWCKWLQNTLRSIHNPNFVGGWMQFDIYF